MRSFILAATLLAATASNAATLTETIDRTINVRPGAKVVVSNVNGRINVSSWDQPRVRVVARKQVEAKRDDLRGVMNELRVEIQPRDGGVVITTHHPRRSDGASSIFDLFLRNEVQAQVRYDITVPRTMNVDISNTNGAIQLTGVNGSLELGTTNGRIEVERCSGAIDASTTNGAIRAQLLNVARGASLRLETTNGRIEVEVPATLAASIDAGTTNGSITSDLPVAATRISRNSLRGTVNGGGTQVRLRTTNGAIAIRTAGSAS